jgi:hypothetical protein
MQFILCMQFILSIAVMPSSAQPGSTNEVWEDHETRAALTTAMAIASPTETGKSFDPALYTEESQERILAFPGAGGVWAVHPGRTWRGCVLCDQLE